MPRTDASGDGRQSETLALLGRALRGDDGARGDLFRRLRPRLVLWIAARLSAELRSATDPEDLAQEVLLVAHRDLSRLDGEPGPAFYGWLFRIAENRIRDLVDYRRAKKRQAAPLPEDPPTSPSMACERDESLAHMREAIGRLPEDYRQVLRLLRFEERSVAETARLLDRSEGAVRILHLRALKALRREMGASSPSPRDFRAPEGLRRRAARTGR